MGAMTSCDNKICQTMTKLHAAAQKRKVSRNVDFYARPKFLRIRRKPRKIVCKCTCIGSCRSFGKPKSKGCNKSYVSVKKKTCSVQVQIDIPNCSKGCGDDDQKLNNCQQNSIPCQRKPISCESKKTTSDFGCSPECLPQQSQIDCQSQTPQLECRPTNIQSCRPNNTETAKCDCRKQKKTRNIRSVSNCCNDATVQTSYTYYCTKFVETEFDSGTACHCMKKLAISCVGDQNYDCNDTDSVSYLDDDFQIPTRPTVSCPPRKNKCKAADCGRSNIKGKKVIFRDTKIQTCTPDNCSKFINTEDGSSPKKNKNDLLNDTVTGD